MGTKSVEVVLDSLQALGEHKQEIVKTQSPVIIKAVEEFGLDTEESEVEATMLNRIDLYDQEWKYKQLKAKISKTWAKLECDVAYTAKVAKCKELHKLFQTIEVRDDDGKLLYKIPQVHPEGEDAIAYNKLQANVDLLKQAFEQNEIVPLTNELALLLPAHKAFQDLERKEQKEWDAKKKA